MDRDINPWYGTDEASERLRDRFVETFGAEPVDLLVVVPSNADAVVAACLGCRPRAVLLLLTVTGPVNDAISSGVLAAHEALVRWSRTRRESAPELFCIPEPEDGLGLQLPQILPALVSHPCFNRRRRGRVVYLATGGTSEHTTILARQGEVTNEPVMLVNTPRDRDGGFVASETNFTRDRVPREVIERHALLTALRATRDRRYDAALAALDDIPQPHGDEVSATRQWVMAWRARDAMDFATARREAIEARRIALDAAPTGPVRDIAQRARVFAELCEELSAPPGEGADIPLILEVAWRGVCEEAAGRLHLAGLLYYRAIEAVLGERLRTAWGIDDGSTGPRVVPTREDRPGLNSSQIKDRFEDARKSLGLRALNVEHPLGLMAKFALLVALDDPQLPREALEVGNQLREASVARNQGLFAHGFLPAVAKDVNALATILGLSTPAKRGKPRVPKPELGVLSLLELKHRWQHLCKAWKAAQGPQID